MKERPILFRGEMVRAILEGRKTMTRRPLKGIDLWDDAVAQYSLGGHHGPGLYVSEAEYPEEGSAHYPCPYGQPGDRLWVRETWYCDNCFVPERGELPKARPSEVRDEDFYYRSDGECCEQIPECQCADAGKVKWRPSIHMPRWASRILLEIVSVRVERIQEISEKGAMAEGYRIDMKEPMGARVPAVTQFMRSWNATYPGSWDRNDWVWVVEFKRIEGAGA